MKLTERIANNTEAIIIAEESKPDALAPIPFAINSPITMQINAQREMVK